MQGFCYFTELTHLIFADALAAGKCNITTVVLNTPARFYKWSLAFHGNYVVVWVNQWIAKSHTDRSVAWQLHGTRREEFTMNWLGVSPGCHLQPVKYCPYSHKGSLDGLLPYSHNHKVFWKICLSCDFFIDEKNSSLNTLRDAQTSSKMGIANTRMFKTTIWLVSNGTSPMGGLHVHHFQKRNNACGPWDVQRLPLHTTNWQNSVTEATGLKGSLILSSGLPLCWGNLVAVIVSSGLPTAWICITQMWAKPVERPPLWFPHLYSIPWEE